MKIVDILARMNLMKGDCLEMMKLIPGGSVDLTVTSPPYDNLRTYNDSLDDWGPPKWEAILFELFRLTKFGGVVVWVVGDAVLKGSETGTSFKQALYAASIGFNLHDTMIWQKTKIVPMDFKCNRYYQEFEYMFVFSKGKPSTCNYIKIDSIHAGKKAVSINRAANGEMRLDRVEKQKGRTVANTKTKGNIWAYSNKTIAGHPAPFPEDLALDHIISWSNPGDTVFDPLMGSGTAGVAAAYTGRKFIGIERDDKYFAIAQKRIEEALTAAGVKTK